MTEETPIPLSPATAYIPALAVIVIALAAAGSLFWHWRRERVLDIPAALWAIPFAVPLVTVAVWAAMGILVCDEASIRTLSALGAVLGGAAVLGRRYLFAWIDRRETAAGNVIATIRDIVVIVAVSVLSVIALEVACNDNLPRIPSNSLGFAIGLVAILLVILYFLGQRRGATMLLAPIACCVFGIAEHFVVQFKGEAILPSDILALGTAIEVREGYSFTFTQEIVTSLIFLVITFFLLSLVRPKKVDTSYIPANVGGNLLCALAVTVLAFTGFAGLNIDETLGFGMDLWWPISTYVNEGFITSFATMVEKLPIEEPDGYSDKAAEKIQSRLAAAYDADRGSSDERKAAVAQFDELKPAVIGIMNESFSDLSCFEQLQAAGYTGPAFYNSLPDTLVRGTMLSSVTGGGTANSEFEFLTGNSMAFVGVGKIPYQLYQMSDVDSLAKDLTSAGYTATAMHPQNAINYHRDQIYRQLGFGDFLSIEDFEGAPGYHAGVTDRSTYDKILDLLRQDSSPQFIFDVTMQNHGGYEDGSVPQEELTGYQVDGVDASTLSALNTYLTCINASDRDLEYFIGELRNIGRPVVLVFFGDHQPSVASSLNDQLNVGEDDASHAYRTYQSTYFVWANYEVAGAGELNVSDTMGAGEIAATVLDKIGAPLTDYQKAMLATRSEVPTINVAGYLGADGLRYDLASADSPYAATIDEMRRVAYLNFARKVQ